MSASGRVIAMAERLPVAGSALLSLERKVYNRYLARVRREAGDRVYQATGGVIGGGLFAGMMIERTPAWGSDHYSTITGQYERELQPVLGRACELDYGCFVDIGCANGFYAVGLAVKSRAARVYAYDINPDACRATERNARLNGVAARVEVDGRATADRIDAHVRDHASAFLVCDIEGAEIEVIDPTACPALLGADMLIELHGDMPAAIAEFERRFVATHRLFVIGRLSRSPFDDQMTDFASEDDAWISVSEGRGFARQNWLFMVREGSLDAYDAVLGGFNIQPVRV